MEHGARLNAETSEIFARFFCPLRVAFDGGESGFGLRQKHRAGGEPFRRSDLKDAFGRPLTHSGKEIRKRFVGRGGIAPLFCLLAEGVKL